MKEPKPEAARKTRAGLAARRKGIRGEQECAQILRDALPEIADSIRRGWQARLGSDAPDILGLPGFWVEHKCGRFPNIREAFKQAKTAAGGRAIPLAVIQDDHARDRICVMNLSDLTRVLRAAYGYTQPLRYGVQIDLFEDDQSKKLPAELLLPSDGKAAE